MQFAAAIFAFAAVARGVVIMDIVPAAPAPPGCLSNFNNGGSFTFTTHNLTSANHAKRDDLDKRVVSCGGPGILTLTLINGKLIDSLARTGYIARDNRQFQFDGPPQAGYDYTAGFSVCGNNSIALGGSTIFYNCFSGTLTNLYDKSLGQQCYPVTFDVTPCISDKPPVTVPSPLPPGGVFSTSTEYTSGESTMSMSATTSSMTSSMTMSTSSSPAAASTTAASTMAAMTPVTGSNSTSPAITGSAAPAPTSPASSKPAPSPFTGAGAVLAAGQKIVGLAAAGAAFALL